MTIYEIELLNFRGYRNIKINFHPQLNILYGKNASGKTNFLEAINYLSSLKSFRGVDDQQLVNHNQHLFKIKAKILASQENELVCTKYYQNKYLSINNQEIKKMSDFIGVFNCVTFTPEDVWFFQEQPKFRRRFLDLELCKIDGFFLEVSRKYQKILNDKNKLLKNPHVDQVLLEIFNQEFIQLMEIISNKRQEFIEKIVRYTNDFFQLHHLDFHLTYKFLSSSKIKKSQLLNFITSNEIKTRKINVGAHRDDVVFYLNECEIGKYASQGEKRIIMIVFKIILLKIIEEQTNERPILILDDIFSELDIYYRKVVLSLLQQDIQVIISCCNQLEEFDNYDAYFFLVDKHQIFKQENR